MCIRDRGSEQAIKTGEAAEGVLAMLDAPPAPKPLQPWLQTVKTAGAAAYPGSPAIAASCLGQTDRMFLFEKHPREYDALYNAFKHDDRIQAKRSDGYGNALKLAPRRHEQMVVLVDPSYETTRDMDSLAEWAPRALRRWPDAAMLIWLPLFRDEREQEFGAYLSELEAGTIAGARWPVEALSESSLVGSAMVAYRINKTTGGRITKIASSLQSYWSNA